jgi:hypothetical protein
MRIGASLLMITIGAIIAFGLRVDPRSVDLDAVGWIFITVGVVGLVLNHFVWERRKEAAHFVEHPDIQPDIYVDEPLALHSPDPATEPAVHVETPPTLDPRYAQDPRIND